MSSKRLAIKFYTISDYEDEEIWLRKKHKSGWKLKKTVLPCFYIFESCTPEDVVYRLDYKNNTQNGDYFQIYQDYGWEYFNCCSGWLYFRKPVLQTDTEQDTEIFSDDISRIDMINYIFKTRMLPLLIIFFCCVLPNFVKSIIHRTLPFSDTITVIYTILFVLYLCLFLHCGLKLRKLKKRYSKK